MKFHLIDRRVLKIYCFPTSHPPPKKKKEEEERSTKTMTCEAGVLFA